MRNLKSLALQVGLLTMAAHLCGCLYFKHGETETINFQSEPPGAQVVVNGTPYGNTPTDVTLSRCQTYEAKITKSGFTPASLEISRGL